MYGATLHVGSRIVYLRGMDGGGLLYLYVMVVQGEVYRV